MNAAYAVIAVCAVVEFALAVVLVRGFPRQPDDLSADAIRERLAISRHNRRVVIDLQQERRRRRWRRRPRIAAG